MSGRELPPPPAVIADFKIEWRNWLYLLFQHIRQRTFNISIAAIDGLGVPGQAVTTMTKDFIGFAPVALAQDLKRQDLRYSTLIPGNWVIGTPLIFGVTFSNKVDQIGVVVVETEIQLGVTEVGGDLGLMGGIPLTMITPLPNDVEFETLHYAEVILAASPILKPLMSIHFILSRVGNGINDSCVGDVGYKDIVIKYTGFITRD